MTQANKNQISLLTNFMQEHTNLAKSFSGKGTSYKESHKMLWDKLTSTLNANGPPTKTTQEWKRIWTTRKYSAKKKLIENKKFIKQTGGGPYMELPLDATEEAIVQACGIEAAIAGISGVSSFGCGEEFLDFDEPGTSQATERDLDEPGTSQGTERDLGEPGTFEATTRVSPTVTPYKQLKRKEPQVDESVLLSRRQIELQEQFLNMQSSLKSSLESIEGSINDMNESLKTLCTIREKEMQATIALRQEELRLKRMEIELARAMNELKVLKLQR